MKHITVLKDEAIKYLSIKPNGIYVDATIGGGGHSYEILKLIPQGFLYGFDQDLVAVEKAKNHLSEFSNFEIIDTNFQNIKEELEKRHINKIDGLLMDLGMSSFQIDDATRGFSYMHNNDLDMRMDKRSDLTAKEILNTYDLDKLISIFRNYGEEKNAYLIAKKIIEQRPINDANSLVQICDKVNYKQKGHSSKRIFQALRIEVNQELKVLEKLLEDGYELLKVGGVMVCLTFHSLEDRIVKHFFKNLTTVNKIKGLPIIDEEPKAVLLNKKPVYPSEEELRINSRSKSAILRSIKKTKSN